MNHSGSSEDVKTPAKGEISRSQIPALVHLLGDDDPKIYTAAWNHIVEIGTEALPLVDKAAGESHDPGVRARAAELLTEWKREKVLERWKDCVGRGDLDLELGALLISRSEYPDEGEDEGCAQLDGYSDMLKRRLGTARTTEVAVRKTVELLSGELGFSGLNVDYLDPENSYLHRVLERRAGLPILLSTVYASVADRVGLTLCGVGMPQHFILKYRTPHGERFLDPFHDGGTLSRSECETFIEQRCGLRFQESFLREVSDVDILSRMLGNLMRVYHAQSDRQRLNRVLTMLQSLENA